MNHLKQLSILLILIFACLSNANAGNGYMIKLYKKTNNNTLYWEAWAEDNQSYVTHSGEIGKRGKTIHINSSTSKNVEKEIDSEARKLKEDGFAEINLDDYFTLLIEYKIDGLGSSADLEKRHNLQDRMQETLGWTGLGFCDGGSAGSGTMEVCCLVVDFELAKQVIEKDLLNTEFDDYIRIFQET